MDTTQKSQGRHIGRKVGRIRDLLGIKQEFLAEKLGVSQQAISKLEQSEQIEDATLDRVAAALGIKSDAIRNFNDESIIYNIQNNYDSSANNSGPNYHCTFNPIDKLIWAMEENRRLYEELLKSEREKIKLLEKIIERSKT